MLSFSVSSFERRLFLLAIAKLGDYLSLYGVSVLHRSERRGVPRVGGLPGGIMLIVRGCPSVSVEARSPPSTWFEFFLGAPAEGRNSPAANPKESVGRKATCFPPHACITI